MIIIITQDDGTLIERVRVAAGLSLQDVEDKISEVAELNDEFEPNWF